MCMCDIPGQSKMKLISDACPLHVKYHEIRTTRIKRKVINCFRIYRRININNYVAEKWLLQLFPVDLIDYGNVLP